MYERKTPDHLECGIKVTAKVIGSKWKPCIIDAITRGVHRPGALQREVGLTSRRVIQLQLKELEMHGIVEKQVFPVLPQKVEYHLTPLGQSILDVLNAMNTWGEANRERYSGELEPAS
ncbi:transcriptional regulator [Pedobacter yulinensis]|uniref:Transcriptional regulator n=1 Tax=Pedobacter yulinensis TaxID=2126353 RepID=A0A2T3HMC0_9SPHI|nr:helix-turn-helix domain-containing protein [Pedobacter yulinensis]PST83584.1 transcriptional regulator [Pedobacter yulinensis]